MAADRPLSPDEILAAAQLVVQSLSLATIYRNLAAFVKEGWLQPVTLPGMASRYERSGKAHHHHFHCNACDKVFELEGCATNFQMKLPRGFKATDHEIFMSGQCGECR